MGNNFHKSGLGSDFEKDLVPFETAPLPNLPPQAGEGTARAMLRLMAYCLTVPSPACGGRLGRGAVSNGKQRQNVPDTKKMAKAQSYYFPANAELTMCREWAA